jgi:hypothetical protein
MKNAAILALVAAASVSALDVAVDFSFQAGVEIKTGHSKTYGATLPSYQHYSCDATAKACYDPKGYGKDYKSEGYSYERKFPYPGPKERFCNTLKKLAGLIKGVINKVISGFKHTWVHFKNKFSEWCAIVKSDAERFKYWKECKEKEFEDWWGYYHDLCHTRKALWDDAMREFHRQWCHMKKQLKEEYEEKKKKCGIKKKDYDDRGYDGKPNEYGATPIETHYAPVAGYEQPKYDDYCKKRDEEYVKENKSDGHSPQAGFSVEVAAAAKVEVKK